MIETASNTMLPVPGSTGESSLVRILTAVFFLLVAFQLIRPFFGQASWMILLQDDFFYYLKVAQNVVHGHGSTFNGIVPTNGYQPLWTVPLIAVSAVTEKPSHILAAIALLNFAATAITFLLARRLLNSTTIRPLLSFALYAWLAAVCLALFFYGMEVTLTVPLLFGVICMLREIEWLERSPLHTFAFGLLLSAMVLSRIDTLIFGGLLLAGILVSPKLRQLIQPRLLLGLIAGLLPVVAYFLFNHIVFDTWLPVSGMAKEIKADHIPSLRAWRDMIKTPLIWYNLVTLSSLFPLTYLLRKMTRIDRVLVLATLLFPYTYYLILSSVSDWAVWPWYWYPFRPALLITCLLWGLWAPSAYRLQSPVALWMLIVTALAYVGLHRWTHQQADDYSAALMVKNFEATHPGIYAMGDRAGRVGYMLSSPVIQLEGLMMDREYLKNIEDKVPLRQVMARYGVRYYVATAYQPFSGCFEASEPAIAGPASAHMRDEFCDRPVAVSTDNGKHTMIFDLSNSTAAPTNALPIASRQPTISASGDPFSAPL